MHGLVRASNRAKRNRASQEAHGHSGVQGATGHLSFFRRDRPVRGAISSGGRVHESRQRQFHAERRAATRFGFEFYLAVMQLYKSKRVCQPDAASPGRVVKKS